MVERFIWGMVLAHLLGHSRSSVSSIALGSFGGKALLGQRLRELPTGLSRHAEPGWCRDLQTCC